jgi:hypothetical protein
MIVRTSHSRTSSQWRGSIAAVNAVLEWLLSLRPFAGPIEVEIPTLQAPLADIVDGLAKPKRDLDLWKEFFSLQAELEGETSITVTVHNAEVDRRWLLLKEKVTAAAVKEAKNRS